MTEPIVNAERLRTDLRKSVIAMAVLAIFLMIAVSIVLFRFPTPTRFARQMTWLGAILFGVLPAITCVLLTGPLRQQRFWALVTALSVTCTDFFLILIAATFISTGIVAETISKALWAHVAVMTALSLPFSWTIYTLMRSYDSMKPDDWNVG